MSRRQKALPPVPFDAYFNACHRQLFGACMRPAPDEAKIDTAPAARSIFASPVAIDSHHHEDNLSASLKEAQSNNKL